MSECVVEWVTQIALALVWPVVAVVFIVLFRSQVAGILSRLSKLKVELPNGLKFDLDAQEAGLIASEMLQELDERVRDMTESERSLLSRILASNRSPLVNELFPDFERGSLEHECLRSLRRRHLARPVEGGTWRSYKHVEITRFGHLALRVRRQEILGERAA